MFFDIHTHVLPGFDDGSPDLETSLAMLQLAAEHGTGGMVATPHLAEGDWQPSWERVVDSCRLLAEAASERKLGISIYPGVEAAFYSGIEAKSNGPGAYCINGGRYMLVELPANQLPVSTDDFFFTLQSRGVIPVLAHPERYPKLQEEPERLLEWIERGILLQVNGASLVGRMGTRIMNVAETLLQCQMIHCIASDGHGLSSRRPILKEAAAKVTAMVGPEMARSLFTTNPQSIIANQPVLIPEPDERRFLKRPKLFGGLFKMFGSR
jgi:protein-tyrosine phosphatase